MLRVAVFGVLYALAVHRVYGLEPGTAMFQSEEVLALIRSSVPSSRLRMLLR